MNFFFLKIFFRRKIQTELGGQGKQSTDAGEFPANHRTPANTEQVDVDGDI